MPSTNTPANLSSAQSVPAKRKRKFRSEAEWRNLIQRFDQSDMTQVAFCKQHGITTSGLNLWRKRLTDTVGSPASDFVPLGILPEHNKTGSSSDAERRWQVELEFAPGRTLKITLG